MRYGGHVDGQEQKRFSPLGILLSRKFFQKKSIVLTLNVAALSRGCKKQLKDIII